jgi:N-acetylglucosamine kinase
LDLRFWILDRMVATPKSEIQNLKSKIRRTEGTIMSYILGVDGGGTKTVALVANWNGHILGQGVAGPSNYHTVGLESAVAAITEAAHLALENAKLKSPKLDVASLGLAGTGRPGDATLMEVTLQSAHIAAEVFVTHDAAVALAGATACEPGVIVNAGTGAIAYGMNSKGETKRVDGWGHLIGDAGSAYDIARRALVAAFRAYDGRGPETMLTKMLVNYFQTRTMEDIVGLVYTHREKKQHIASAAPVVVEAANKGDAVSLSILRNAGHELGLSAGTVVRGLGMSADEVFPPTVAYVGGVFAGSEPAAFRDAFRQALVAIAPKAKIIEPRFPSAVGALLIALKKKGKLTSETLLAVEASCKKHKFQAHE